MKRKHVINALESLRQESNDPMALNIAIEAVKNYRKIKILEFIKVLAFSTLFWGGFITVAKIIYA